MDDLEALGTELTGLTVPAVLSDLLTNAVLGANAGAAELLGRRASELVGADVISLIHPRERPGAASGLAALASGAVDSFQVRNRHVIRPNGEAIAVDISGRRLEPDSGRLALWIFASADQEVVLGEPGPSGDLVLALTDHDWQVEYMSTDVRLFGDDRQALIGASLLGLVHPSRAAELLEATSRAVAVGITVSLLTLLRSGKNVWTERRCLLVPVCEHKPPRLGVVFFSIGSTASNASANPIAAEVLVSALDIRAADALGTLAAISALPGFPELSSRQIEILSRVVRGEAVADIASALYLSPSTVRNHLTMLYRKFGVHSKAELLAQLLRTSSISA